MPSTKQTKPAVNNGNDNGTGQVSKMTRSSNSSLDSSSAGKSRVNESTKGSGSTTGATPRRTTNP